MQDKKGEHCKHGDHVCMVSMMFEHVKHGKHDVHVDNHVHNMSSLAFLLWSWCLPWTPTRT
jgi:hypothetical protein